MVFIFLALLVFLKCKWHARVKEGMELMCLYNIKCAFMNLLRLRPLYCLAVQP